MICHVRCNIRETNIGILFRFIDVKKPYAQFSIEKHTDKLTDTNHMYYGPLEVKSISEDCAPARAVQYIKEYLFESLLG